MDLAAILSAELPAAALSRKSPLAGDLDPVHNLEWQSGFSAGVDNLFDKRYAVANDFVHDPFRSGVVVNEPGRFF